MYSLSALATKPYIMVGTISNRAKLLLAVDSIIKQSRNINQYKIRPMDSW